MDIFDVISPRECSCFCLILVTDSSEEAKAMIFIIRRKKHQTIIFIYHLQRANFLFSIVYDNGDVF